MTDPLLEQIDDIIEKLGYAGGPCVDQAIRIRSDIALMIEARSIEKRDAEIRIAGLTAILTGMRHFFESVRDQRAVEGPDQRFIRKLKMRIMLYYGEVVAILDNISIDEAYRRIIEHSINDQPPDTITMPSGLVISRKDEG